MLKNCGQITLAYLTAINHGLDEEAGDLYESLPTNKETGEKIVPQANPDAKLFNPSPPILHTDSNWPLLTVSKGFFDGVASARSAAAGNGNTSLEFCPQAALASILKNFCSQLTLSGLILANFIH